MKKRLLLLGVTASGKARLAHELARRVGGEILSVDSMKVYRRMDIGTAKPPDAARREVPYHLLDVVEPSEAFSTGRFLTEATAAIDAIEARRRPVIAVGGTALYIKALLFGLFEGPAADAALRAHLHKRAETEGLDPLHRELAAVDPVTAARVHPNDARRIVRALEVHHLTGRPISSLQTQFEALAPDPSWQVVGLRRPKACESGRINARVRRMVESGLVAEVTGLLAGPAPLSKQAAAAIGYAEIIAHLEGQGPLAEAVERIKINTRRLAKHQRTWFRTFPAVTWFDLADTDEVEGLVPTLLDQWAECA